MRIKVLIPPFFIVMTLILIIGYIKPDLDVLQVKKADILAKEDNVANMAAIIQNTGTLNSSLDKEQDFEKLVYRYLPSTLNQEQVVDAFNFLAAQSGVVITKMDLKAPVVQKAVPEEAGGDASGRSKTAFFSTVRTFAFTGSVVGSYENIKAFFDRLAHMERFQKISLFSIETDLGIQPLDTNHLIGTFGAEFGYLPPEPMISALNVPIFRHPEFDFSNEGTLSKQMTGLVAVPILEKDQTGRPNPFQ